MSRTYLDWNASAPLRPEARDAMLAAMDMVGNPSSVHSEGRAAKAVIEKARGQVACLVGCEPGEVVFTSGATEASAQVLSSRVDDLDDRHPPTGPLRFERIHAAPSEHDCVWAYAQGAGCTLGLTRDGQYDGNRATAECIAEDAHSVFVMPSVSGETGVNAGAIAWPELHPSAAAILFTDATQAIGKTRFNFKSEHPAYPGAQLDYAAMSAHKLGGSRGIGALLVRAQIEAPVLIRGGGHELGRRSGTENVIGIAGFGAAAEAAQRDLEDGAWDRIMEIRDRLEDRLATEAPDLIIFGHDAPRLPNTSCFAVPGWKGETQVMQMDLAGFAISAGSACASGKVNRGSRVLLAMGFDELTASSAIRVSMGPTTTEDEVMGFTDTWIEHYRRRKSRAA